MKNKVSHFLLVALLSSYAHGQRGLTKIPDTSIQAQLDAFVLPEGAKINLFVYFDRFGFGVILFV